MEQSDHTFSDAVLKICLHYFDSFVVMKDCPSSKSQINLEQLDQIIVEPITMDDEEDLSSDNNNDSHPNNQNDESQPNSHLYSQSSNTTTVEVVATTSDLAAVSTPVIVK